MLIVRFSASHGNITFHFTISALTGVVKFTFYSWLIMSDEVPFDLGKPRAIHACAALVLYLSAKYRRQTDPDGGSDEK